MTDEQATALATIAVFAAFADGNKSDAEREQVKQVLASLGQPRLAEVLRAVVMKETSLSAQTALLTTPELRTLAWESALGVCEADGATTPGERQFLDELARLLGRPDALARAQIAQADRLDHEIRDTPVRLPVVVPPAAPGVPPAAPNEAQPSAVTPVPDPRSGQVDTLVLRFAVLTAAVELLPENLSTLAIIPLQTKMVHSIGSVYGHRLSAASIKEFIATIGIGLTGQMLERQARKLLGGLAGRVLGGLGRTAANWSTGPALTFATTYAIGMVAKQYYAGGRSLSAINLKALYHEQFEKARSLYTRYEPQVTQTARTTSTASLLQSLRQ